jgi:ABC-type branched-subunit amino acid transport system substrate-binding protein
VAGRYLVEFVALNDFNEAQEAVVQVRKMTADPGVMGMLGGWSSSTAHSAASECQRLGLAFLAPAEDLAGAEMQTLAGYQDLSGGVPPGPAAIWAYQAANRLLDALDTATRTEGHPTREGVRAALNAGQQ